VANLNKIMMIGRLTKDPVVRSPGGRNLCELRLATSREWRDKSGEKQKDVCYVDVSVWGKQGEACAEYLSKGRLVFIEGRLDYQEWEKDGQRRSKHQIVAERVQFLDRAADRSSAGPSRPMYGGTADGTPLDGPDISF
jgi:single-strand DNA-binding protein